MVRLRHKLLIQAFRIFDQVVLVGVFILLVAYVEERGRFTFILEVLDKSYQAFEGLAMFGVLLGWFFVFSRMVHYDANRVTTLKSQAIEIAKAVTVTSLLLLLAGAMFYIKMVTPMVVSLFWVVSTAVLIGSRILLRVFLRTWRRAGRNRRHIVFIGGTDKALGLANRIEGRPELGYEIVGFLFGDAEREPKKKMIAEKWGDLGEASQLREVLKKGVVDEVMVCLPIRRNFSVVCEIVQLCQELGVVVRLIPETLDLKVLAKAQVEEFDGDQVVTFFRENLIFQLMLKRLFDVVGSVALLILLSPLLVATALLVRLTSPGPVFFAQDRIGMNKRVFRLLKFRSMVVDAEERKKDLAHLNEVDGPVFKIKQDPRVTPVGKVIRKLSIDELPQLINVMLGEMSLVGPRPPLPSEVDLYDWTDRKRLSIRPGITCLWQVSGRNELSFQEWMELDRAYIDNWSTWLDMKILLRTIPVVLFGKGAS
jgi:exopolysaccharide biosynthesis polyprenyl glycosylphosphotransferase